MILAAAYLLWMVQRVLYGEVTNPENAALRDLSLRELACWCRWSALALFMGVASPLLHARRIEPAMDALVGSTAAVRRRAAAPTAAVPTAAGRASDARGARPPRRAAGPDRRRSPASLVLLAQAFTPRGRRAPSVPLALAGLVAALIVGRS